MQISMRVRKQFDKFKQIMKEKQQSLDNFIHEEAQKEEDLLDIPIQELQNL